MTSPLQDIDTNNASFQWSRYNDPKQSEEIPLMKALGDADTSFEANTLAYKIIAVGELMKRGLLPTEAEGGRAYFGTRIPYDDYFICVDTMIDLPEQRAILVRCLGQMEKLYLEECVFWQDMAQRENIVKIIFVADAELSPFDEAIIKRMMQRSPRVELLHLKKEDVTG